MSIQTVDGRQALAEDIDDAEYIGKLLASATDPGFADVTSLGVFARGATEFRATRMDTDEDTLFFRIETGTGPDRKGTYLRDAETGELVTFRGAVFVQQPEADVDALEDVARRASADCMLNDLDQLDAPLWPAIAGAHRIPLTAHNVAAYIDQHDVDSDLANWLRTAGTITVAADDATPLGPLAVNLLNAVALGNGVKLQLVDVLRLGPGSIAAASLGNDAHTVVPALVQKGLVLDDADAYTILGDDEWEIKKELISVSKAFPNYMTEVPLSADELIGIASGAVPDPVKEVLLSELEVFAPKLGRKGAIALATWAAAEGRRTNPDAIVTMATKGGWESTQPILKLLGAEAATIDLGQLQSALNALGKPYSKLTTPGWNRPQIDVFEGVAAVLARLQKAGIVSKFEKNAVKHVFEVSKRHS